MLYNVFWTSWPCIFTYIFDRVKLNLYFTILGCWWRYFN